MTLEVDLLNEVNVVLAAWHRYTQGRLSCHPAKMLLNTYIVIFILNPTSTMSKVTSSVSFVHDPLNCRGQHFRHTTNTSSQLLFFFYSFHTFHKMFGEVADEVIGTFESGLSEALSEDNVRAAFQQWRRLLGTPGVKPIAQDRRLWAAAKRTLRQHLNSYMSETSAMEAEKAVNATTDFALHFA